MVHGRVISIDSFAPNRTQSDVPFLAQRMCDGCVVGEMDRTCGERGDGGGGGWEGWRGVE